MTFDLMTVVNEEIEGPVADLDILAEHVTKRIPDSQLRPVVQMLMRTWLHNRVTLRRANVSRSTASATARDRAGDATGESRWATAGDMYQRLLHQRESVDGEWKFLGEMTADDVRVVAQQRIDIGKASIARGNVFKGLAAVMVEAKAVTVADLSQAQLTGVFS